MSNNTKKINKNIKKQPQVALPVKKSYSVFISATICFLFAFILYSNTFKHSYVLDDGGTVTDNWVIKKGVQGIPIILKTTYRYGANNLGDNLYRPLSQVMFAIESDISPNNPYLNHFLNVLFYALSCCLLFIVLSKYLIKVHTLIPLVITLIYVVHPIHTEVVANIKSRDEIMSFFFLMLTLLFLHKWFIKSKWWSLIVSLIMFFLAFISKEGVITMLFLFPIMGWYFTDAKPKVILTASLMLIIPAITYIAIRHQILSKYSVTSTFSFYDNFLVGVHDPFKHFATAVMLLGKYLLLSVIPYQLVCDYSYNQIPTVGLSDMRFILSIIIYLAIGIYVILNFRKKSPLAFGLLFFLITISMYSNILFHIGTPFGERLMFLPSLGICIAIVLLIDQWLKVGATNKKQTIIMEVLRSKPLFTVICIAIIFLYSIKTVVRAAEWKNEYILYGKDIEHSPNSAHLCMWWGNSLYEKAEKEKDKATKDTIMYQAIAMFEKGLTINPNYLECYEQLSVAWSELGDFDKALYYGNHILKIDSTKAITWHNIGLFYYKLNDYENALRYYKKAVTLDTTYADAYLNIGNILGVLQRYEEAIVEFKKCIKFDPNNILAHSNIGLSYQYLKQPEEANQWYEKARILEQNKNK